MAFRVDDFQKQARFPEEGTPEFMVVMGRSLKAYDAALDLLIEVMELLRESFMEMVETHYGLSTYEEFLKDKLEVSQESFEQQAQEAAESNVKENLAANLIAETVGIDISDEAVQAGMEEMAKTLGFDSVDELVEDAPNRAYVERMVIREKVMDWAAEHSKQVEQ
jgi:FKBP-type peptidyl-prolyl cis-trans isomerase (trigger factor)